MKEDITQREILTEMNDKSCGLVMKEDITQQAPKRLRNFLVVVW